MSKSKLVLMVLLTVLASVAIDHLINSYQELEVKQRYNDLVEWEQGIYGRITWVQDIDEINATEVILSVLSKIC